MPPKIKPKQIKQMVQSSNILPPGTDKGSDQSFGEFSIKMGKVSWIQDSNPHSGNLVYRIFFWGQEGDGLLIQALNQNLQYPNELKYDIRVPIIQFHKYLNEAEKVIIYLVDSEDKFQIFGYISINFARHLNKDLSKNQVFHNISGQYPIYKYFSEMPDNKEYKIGYQNIEVNSKFILIKQQIDLCSQLNQSNNIQQLQNIMIKEQQQQQQQQQNKQTQYPQINVIFPTENEAWLQQNPDQKLANVLFANNPFQKITDVNPNNFYERNNYIDPESNQIQHQINQIDQDHSNLNNQNINTNVSPHKVSPSKQEQNLSGQKTQVQGNVKFADEVQNRIEQLLNSVHCLNCCPQKQKRSDSVSNQQNTQDNSSNKKNHSIQKQQEPFRNSKPNSGHYNNSPTQYRYANKPENTKPNPPKFKSNRNQSPVEQIDQNKQKQNEFLPKQEQVEKPLQVKSTYQIETKGVQTIQEEVKTPPYKTSNQSFVYNQSLDSYRKLKLQLIDFHAYSQQVQQKLNAINLNNIFIDCQLKNQQKRTFFKSQGQDLYQINESVEFEVFINESSFNEFQADQIKFLIQCYRKPENSDDQKYFKITLGEGYFQVIKAISNEEFYVIINTNLPFDRSNSSQNSGLQYSVVNKDLLNEYQIQQQNRLGEIRLRASLIRNQEQQNFIDQPIYYHYHSFNPTLLIRLGKIVGVDKINCRFKIPGSNDFFQSQLNDSVYLNYQVITPLNFDSFEKIEISPFIIEVWKDKELLGMIRISLKSIHQILINEDQEFNANIFKNIYPLIISDEQHPIKKVRDSQQIGSIHVLIAFGIPGQINKIKIENIYTKSIQEVGNQYEEPQKEQEIQNVDQEIQIEEIPKELTFLEKYEQFNFELIDNYHQSIIEIFQYLNKNDIQLQKNIPKGQFFNIEQLQFIKVNEEALFVFIKIFDFKNQHTIKKENMLNSLTAFNIFKPKISVEVNKQIKKFIQYLIDQKQDPLEYVGKMLQRSDCGIMEKQKLEQYIPNFNTDFFGYFLGQSQDRKKVSIKLLYELTCQFISFNYVKLEEINEFWYCLAIQSSILQKAQTIQLEDVQKMCLNIEEVQEIFNQCLINVSFWEVYCIFRFIKIKNNNFVLQDWEIQKSLLQDWFQIKQDEVIPPTIQKKPKQFELEDKENQNQENKNLEFFVHKFSITLKEIQNLKLQTPYGTQLQVEYKYPLCEQIIKSYPLVYSKQTQYQCPSESSYTYIQQIDENNKFIDVVDSIEGGMYFRLKADEKNLAQTFLSSQEIVSWMDKNTDLTKDKVLVFMPINAKLSFTINYQRQKITQQQLSSNPELLSSHNQTQQEVHLPKRIGLNVYAEVTLNDKALKFEDKIIKVDIYSVSNFTAQISKQQGKKTVIINEEKQLQVDNELIQNLSTQQMIIQVSSNTQNLIGKCELMQTQLLRGQIDGEFALTNQFGLFVGVAKLKCQLNKYKIPLVQQQTILKEKEQEERQKQITCLISIREIITNISQLLKPTGNDQSFVYFILKHNGKSHQTNLEQIDKKKFSCQLVQSFLAIEMQSYSELTITVYSSKKNAANQLKDVKLGDINIKFNHLTQSQIDSRFICLNEYFTLNYDSFISRVGIKLMLINEYEEMIPNMVKFYSSNQIYGCQKLSDLQQNYKIDRQLYEYIVKLVNNNEYSFLSDQIGYHLNKQNFFLSEQNLTWDLIEEVYKLSNNGFMEEQKAKQLLDSFYIVNFNEKSYSLFTKPNVFDKNAYKYLNQFDFSVFLSKINLNIEVQKVNEIVIQILRAHNLNILNQNKAPNPVIQMLLSDQSFRTPVQVRESNPIYNYCFSAGLEANCNLEFRVLNSGAEREILGSCFLNSSELIRLHEKQSNEEIKMYIHGSKAQAYIVVKVGTSAKTLQTLEEVQQYQIEDVDLERIRAIIGKI